MSEARAIRAHYDSIDEGERLGSGAGLLERERTEEIIRRTLPNPPAVVIDAG